MNVKPGSPLTDQLRQLVLRHVRVGFVSEVYEQPILQPRIHTPVELGQLKTPAHPPLSQGPEHAGTVPLENHRKFARRRSHTAELEDCKRRGCTHGRKLDPQAAPDQGAISVGSDQEGSTQGKGGLHHCRGLPDGISGRFLGQPIYAQIDPVGALLKSAQTVTPKHLPSRLLHRGRQQPFQLILRQNQDISMQTVQPGIGEFRLSTALTVKALFFYEVGAAKNLRFYAERIEQP